MSYSQECSMLSRKIYNMILFTLLLWCWFYDQQKAKPGNGELILQIELMTLGSATTKRPLRFAALWAKKKS